MGYFRWTTLGVVLSLVLCSVGGQVVDMTGQFMCNKNPSNELWLQLFAYDLSNVSVSMHAVNETIDIIPTCTVTGGGRVNDPYYVVSKIDLDTDTVVENDCGMIVTMANGVKIYNWHFKAFAHLETDAFVRVGFLLNVSCDTTHDDGKVETLINLNVTTFSVTPASPNDVTGLNSVAVNANTVYTVNVYPSGTDAPDAIRDANGIYMYNCFSATTPDMVSNREQFIDANGCPVDDADLAPTNGFIQDIKTTERIQLISQFGTAAVVNGEHTLYLTCQIGICTTENDLFCVDRCQAHEDGEVLNQFRQNTDTLVSTSFIVQDAQAQDFFPTESNGGNRIDTTNRNQPFVIVAQFSPTGIGSNPSTQNAKGYYLYNCRYSTNAAFNNPVQFVDNTGCRVSNTDLNMGTDFQFDDVASAPNVYVIKASNVNAGFQGNQRVWVRCDTGICTHPDHNYCAVRRCGTTNNIPGGAQNVGVTGLSFTLSVLDIANEPAVELQSVGPDGVQLTPTDTVNVGDSVKIGVEVTPGGQGDGSNFFSDAEGIFLYDCTASEDGGTPEQFIDNNGCQVPGSQYQLSQSCVDVTEFDGVPPFRIDCGSYFVREEGDIETKCRIGKCTNSGNPYCKNRCAAGALVGNHNTTNADFELTSNYRAEQEDLRRTAVRSEEIDDIVTAVTTALAVIILLAVCVGTWLIVSRQRRRAKRFEDDRDYNYSNSRSR